MTIRRMLRTAVRRALGIAEDFEQLFLDGYHGIHSPVDIVDEYFKHRQYKPARSTSQDKIILQKKVDKKVIWNVI